MKVLLLNSTYEPLAFLTEKRALKLLMNKKVEVVNIWRGEIVKLVTSEFELPSTLRLKSYVRRIQTKSLRFSKQALFNRDRWTCQYCGEQLDCSSATVDHVFPRSKGGKSEWKNCVTSCPSCNKKKANYLLSETNLVLKTQLSAPDRILYYVDRKTLKEWNPDWETYTGFKI